MKYSLTKNIEEAERELVSRPVKATTAELFLFAIIGTKRKSSQKEKCRMGSFARCDERQGLRALDLRPLPWGACVGECEHSFKQ